MKILLVKIFFQQYFILEKADLGFAARRELFEESGAVIFNIFEVADYSAESESDIGFGRLFFAEAEKPETLPQSEIVEVRLFDDIPDNLTYPDVQKILFKFTQDWRNSF